MASITIINKTEVAWLLLNSKANHGTWNTEPGDLPSDETPVKFELDNPDSLFGVDGYVEYAGPGEANRPAMARIIFKSPVTNVNCVKAHITHDSYEVHSEYNADGDLVATITFTLKQSQAGSQKAA